MNKQDLKWLPIRELNRLKNMIQSELDDRMCANFQERSVKGKFGKLHKRSAQCSPLSFQH